MSRPRLIALLLALGTLVVFLPTGGFGFVNYDDPDYVTENVFVKNGLNGPDIAQAFTSYHACNWHPLTWLSHMTDCTLFGLNPGAMHFVNVLIHAANTALLFTLLLRLTKKIWAAAFIAALFAWHPLHIQSVAWISERKDVLSTFFGLLTLLAYAKFAQENSRRDYWLALIFFALGLMAKQMLVTLPFVMLLLDYWPLNRVAGFKSKVKGAEPREFQISNLKFLLVEKIPFFLLVIPACVLTCLAQRAAMSSLERLPFPLRLENSVVTYALYLLKIFWPTHLAFFYPLTARSPENLTIASLVLVIISFLAWRCWRSQPFVIVGWLWFLGMLVPAIGFVQVGEQSMADRYSYLPSVGIFISVTFGALALAERFAFVKKLWAPAAILILVGCMLATEIELQNWRTDEALFSHAVAVTRNNEIAHLNLGVVYEKQGRTADAMREYRVALQINPRRAHTHNNIADLLDTAGQPEAARTEYEAAIALDPNALEAHLNYGILLVELNRFDAAAEQFKLAVTLEPTDARPHYQMGKMLLKRGDDTAAIGELRLALQNDPNNFQMLTYTAHVLAANETVGVRDGAMALALANKANDLTGGAQPFVLDVLGMACAENQDFANAIACAQKAIELAETAQMQNTEPLKSRLALYQSRQPWRESFRATNAPATR